MKDEDNYERFKFTELQLGELKVLLGSSQSVEAFIGRVEGWINQAIWVREKEKYAPTTQGQMKKRLIEYEKLCNTFVQGLSAIDADLSKPDVPVWEKDWEAILLIEGAKLPDVDGNKRDFTDGFVSAVVESVTILGKLCMTAKEDVPPPKKGDLSAYERSLQMTENGIVNDYIQAFGCYPEKINGGAFHDAMNTFYGCAGYLVSNSFRRMGKAIDRCAEAADHNPIPEQFKPKPRLHPVRC